MMKRLTPPPLQGPSSKEKKYDRQLRLWAASGQLALEEAHVLLLNYGCGVVGVETLKNLVLPGVGSFTVADEALVKVEDLGVNFFLKEDAVGTSRAQACCELLKELNPDVQGRFVSESIEACLAESDFLSSFSLIILTSPAPRKVLETVSSAATTYQIPLFHVQSVGFYAEFIVALPHAFPVVDTHPDPASAVEIRLLNPWPELQALAKEKSSALETLSDYEHGHVSYLLLLLHYLDVWKSNHGGLPPQNYKEKGEFKKLVQEGARMNSAEGGEENYDEAVAAVLKVMNPSLLRSGVRGIFEASERSNLTKESAAFWIIAAAIASFHEAHGVLPLPGTLPDMKAQSADYLQLQNVYRSKAIKDYTEVLAAVRQTEARLGRQQSIPQSEVETFCKGAGFVKLVRGTSLQSARYLARSTWGDGALYAYEQLQAPDSLLSLHIAFLAYASLADDMHTRASAPEEPTLNSIAQKETVLLDRAKQLLRDLWHENGKDFDAELQVDETEDDDGEAEDDTHNKASKVEEAVSRAVKELARADGSELHNISALAGGMVAQEAIKVITKQYVPIDNTCLFDGIKSSSAVHRL